MGGKCTSTDHYTKWPVFIFAFGEYISKQVNVSGIQIFRAQFLALNLRKVMLNAANIYLIDFILTKYKYIYKSFYPIGKGSWKFCIKY